MSVVALVIAPSIALNSDALADYNNAKQDVKIEVTQTATSTNATTKTVEVKETEKAEGTVAKIEEGKIVKENVEVLALN